MTAWVLCACRHGGQYSVEELEALGCKAARLCNRLRARATGPAAGVLDEQLAALAPLFQLVRLCLAERPL